MDAPVELAQAQPHRLSALATILGRAFVDEPMMRWPLGDYGDVEEHMVECFERFMENLIRNGMVWEAGAGSGAAIWIPPDGQDVLAEAFANQSRIGGLSEAGRARYDRFWEWVESRMPIEAHWYLDSVGVDREARGRGIGSALVRMGLERARADDVPAFLATGSPRNVPLYEHLGFRVVEAVNAPDGGPPVWFMRWDPARLAP